MLEKIYVTTFKSLEGIYYVFLSGPVVILSDQPLTLLIDLLMKKDKC